MHASQIEKDALGWLVAPTGLKEFRNGVFEKQPQLIRANPERAGVFSKLFDLQQLLTVAQQRQDAQDPLKWGSDITAAKYVNGVRTTPTGKDTSVAELKAMFNKQGCTFQVHQPQRFGVVGENDGLWRILSALESQLGCLVGCNAYITPAKTQGLAPHHDDVELWICQTQGAKRWRLYKPLGGFVLPNQSSGNLSEKGLGEPILDTTLRVGDVLYLPRGTIHQAVAGGDGSAHVTMSTYQRWSTGDFAMRVLQIAGTGQHDATPRGAIWPLPLRRSLPWGFLHHTSGLHSEPSDAAAAEAPSHTGHQAKNKGGAGKQDTSISSGPQATKHAAASVAAGLRAFADQLEARPAALVGQAANDMYTHFICRRLPPHPAQLRDKGPRPSLSDSIVCRGRNLFKVMPAPGEPEDCVITTPVHNDRLLHMTGLGHIVRVQQEGEEGVADGQGGGAEQGGPSSMGSAGGSRAGGDSDDSDDSGSDVGGSEGEDGGGVGVGGQEDQDEDEEVFVVGPEGEQRKLQALGPGKGGPGPSHAGGGVSRKGRAGKQGEEELDSGDEESEEQGHSSSGEGEEGAEGEGGSEDGGEQEGGALQGEEQDLAQFEDLLPGPMAPAEMAGTINEVLACFEEPDGVRVKDLAVKPGVRGKEEALQLAVMLWREGFVSTVPASVRQPAQPQQKHQAKGGHKGILSGVQHSKPAGSSGKKKQRGGKDKKQKGGGQVEGAPSQKKQKKL